MSSLRVLLRGGITSYRALFGWLSPWLLIPMFAVGPLAQILLFYFVGKSTGVNAPSFYLLGNAIQYAAIPCLFAMSLTIGDERQQQTLGLILISPARRLPLYIGRMLPVILNGLIVAMFGLLAGSVLLQVRLRLDQLLPLLSVLAVSMFSCTGMGLAVGAIALRVREATVLPNILFGVLLILSGVNVERVSLPPWMIEAGDWLPLTHGIAAARLVAAGDSAGSAAVQMAWEALVGGMYATSGYLLLLWFERRSRREATLERY